MLEPQIIQIVTDVPKIAINQELAEGPKEPRWKQQPNNVDSLCFLQQVDKSATIKSKQMPEN